MLYNSCLLPVSNFSHCGRYQRQTSYRSVPSVRYFIRTCFSYRFMPNTMQYEVFHSFTEANAAISTSLLSVAQCTIHRSNATPICCPTTAPLYCTVLYCTARQSHRFGLFHRLCSRRLRAPAGAFAVVFESGTQFRVESG